MPIIDTLEFISATADLLDLGWDLKSWMDERQPMHAFDVHIINYKKNMHRLKALVCG